MSKFLCEDKRYIWVPGDPRDLTSSMIFDHLSTFSGHCLEFARKGVDEAVYAMLRGSIHNVQLDHVLLVHVTLAKFVRPTSDLVYDWAMAHLNDDDWRPRRDEIRKLFAQVHLTSALVGGPVLPDICRDYNSTQLQIQDTCWLHQQLDLYRYSLCNFCGFRPLHRSGFHFTVDKVLHAQPTSCPSGLSPNSLTLRIFFPEDDDVGW